MHGGPEDVFFLEVGEGFQELVLQGLGAGKVFGEGLAGGHLEGAEVAAEAELEGGALGLEDGGEGVPCLLGGLGALDGGQML